MKGNLDLAAQLITTIRIPPPRPALQSYSSTLALHDIRRQILKKVARRLEKEKLLRS